MKIGVIGVIGVWLVGVNILNILEIDIVFLGCAMTVMMCRIWSYRVVLPHIVRVCGTARKTGLFVGTPTQ